MKSALRLYSDILQLRDDTFLTLKHAPGGMRYAVLMFLTVALVAGAGIWIGLPALLQQPLLVEYIDQASAQVTRFDQEVVPEINASLDAVSREALSVAVADLLPESGPISAEDIRKVVEQSGLTAADLATAFTSEAANLSGDARTQLEPQLQSIRQALESQAAVTPEQLEALLAGMPLHTDQVAALITRAAAAQAQVEALSTQVGQQQARLERLLAGSPLSVDQIESWLMGLTLAPERLAGMTLQLGLTPEQIERLRTEIDAAPEEVNQVLADLRAGVEQYHPPLGVRFSRFMHMFGEWLATPFVLLANWALFVLMLLVAAKLLGGSGTIRQHLTGMLVAAAPLVLLFLTYVPTVTPMLPLSFNLAFDYVGRILALVGIGWAALILLKSMSVTHNFTIWRAAGAAVLAWSMIYIVIPVFSFLAVGYILRG